MQSDSATPHGFFLATLSTSAWVVAGLLFAQPPTAQVVLRHLKGRIYIGEDSFYALENSVVHVGPDSVTVVGATWTPETASILEQQIRKATSKPIGEVVNTSNYHPDRANGNNTGEAGARTPEGFEPSRLGTMGNMARAHGMFGCHPEGYSCLHRYRRPGLAGDVRSGLPPVD
jgi:hypothetical protein